jgi:hypothetical protein
MLSMKMIFTPEQKIFTIEPYFRNGHTLHTFQEVAVLDPKFELKGTGTTFLMFSQSTPPTGSGVFFNKTGDSSLFVEIFCTYAA